MVSMAGIDDSKSSFALPKLIPPIIIAKTPPIKPASNISTFINSKTRIIITGRTLITPINPSGAGMVVISCAEASTERGIKNNIANNPASIDIVFFIRFPFFLEQSNSI